MQLETMESDHINAIATCKTDTAWHVEQDTSNKLNALWTDKAAQQVEQGIVRTLVYVLPV